MQHDGTTGDNARGPVRVRTYRPEDEALVSQLHRSCAIGRPVGNGRLVPEGSLFEISLRRPGSPTWVAESPDALLGVIGVVPSSAEVGEIAWLHVDPGWQAMGIAKQLLDAALGYCREQGYLKVVFRSPRCWDEGLIEHFGRFGFEYIRTKHAGGGDAREFYRDLYRDAPQRGRGPPIRPDAP